MKHFRAWYRFPTLKNQGAKMMPVQSIILPSHRFPKEPHYIVQVLWQAFVVASLSGVAEQTKYHERLFLLLVRSYHTFSVEWLDVLPELWPEYTKSYRFYYGQIQYLCNNAFPSNMNKCHISRTTNYGSHAKTSWASPMCSFVDAITWMCLVSTHSVYALFHGVGGGKLRLLSLEPARRRNSDHGS